MLLGPKMVLFFEQKKKISKRLAGGGLYGIMRLIWKGFHIIFLMEVQMEEKEIYEEPKFIVIYFDEDDFIKMSTEADLEFPDGWGFGE